MVQKKAKNADNQQEISGIDKVARLLGLLIVRDIETTSDQISMLRAGGFSTAEIATLLNITENNVHVSIHRLKTGKKKNGKK